ncbi:MAG: hypothetical protein RL022_1596 [Chloroflexota bacterium]
MDALYAPPFAPFCTYASLSMSVVAMVIVPGVGDHVAASSPIPIPCVGGSSNAAKRLMSANSS